MEIIDENGRKLNALILCGLKYKNDNYLLYYIKRDDLEYNIFVSKIVYNSENIRTIDSSFDKITKDEIDDIFKRLINKDSILNLNNEDIFLENFSIDNGINKFNVSNSYICSLTIDDIKSLQMYYNISYTNSKINVVCKEYRKNNKKFFINFYNFFTILFAVLSIIYCIVMLILYFVK